MEIFEIYRLGEYIGFTSTLEKAYKYIKNEFEDDGYGMKFHKGLEILEEVYKNCIKNGETDFKCWEYEVISSYELN